MFKHALSLFSLTLAGLAFHSVQAATPAALHNSLRQSAPQLDQQVLSHALDAVQCALQQGNKAAERLAVIDFSLPSSEKRLWIFDLKKRTLLLNDFVAHGAKSGDNLASNFSNINGSHQSSIGLFRSAESYSGKHGYSLRMDGLEPGFNDRARERAIVIHGADYVNPEWIPRQGRIGRSQGCPAVRPEITKTVVDALKDGQLVFTWYPDPQWLQTSSFLNCPGPRLADRNSQRHAGDS
ncbi:murein L,D-transpeptidase catalytic domain family protein [Thiopseudomonas denitrificans]|uniref:L,D-transpeptidase-like protein n=1 Tax=Thiopseudomonas denitrificans TaxID=1501432 RepID=A0A4V3D523_9GAMM|nr:murein L,D-transpeptidase catalytic domain family protein [Thiopseudomonas denitrificans]TDQ38447.1 L,D-transpeptidase-like protein [Thiopseudomonas denitrificans]